MMSSRAPATILLLAMSLGPGLMACGDKPEDSGPVEGDTDSDSDADTDSDTDTGPTDGDGDGVPAHEDCDDTDPSVGGPNAWYSDADQDNYGDPASIQHACEQPSGTVADGSDCDDTDPAVHPAAQEVCDGIDNDCDGAVDDGDDSLDPGTRLTWYQDADGDGWGLETSTLDACDLPAGYCGTSGDCDDGDAAVNPDAWDVIDGVDNDCDGTEDAIPLESAEIVLEGDASYEGAGAAIAGQRDFNGDGFTDLLISAPAADTTTTDVGQVYVLHGPITASMSLAGSDAIITGTEESGYLGFPIAALDDVHGDGNDDLLLSTYGWGEYSWPHESGDLFLFPGPVAGSLSQADARLVIQSDSLVDNRLGDAGDLDGDGLGDAIASSTDHGLVWVLSGAELAGSGTLQLDDLVAPIREAQQGEWLGYAPDGVGDIDGDGLDDFAVGAPAYDTDEAAGAGAMYVFTGGASWPETAAGALATVVYTQGDSSNMGLDLEGGRDLDGDDVPDVVVGVANWCEGPYDCRGAAAIASGAALSGVVTTDTMDILIGVPGDVLGASVSLLGDIDSDGVEEFGVHDNGDPHYGSAWPAYYVAEAPDGRLYTDASDMVFAPASYASGIGRGTKGVGDLNGDEVADMAITDVWGGTSHVEPGTVYIHLGH